MSILKISLARLKIFKSMLLKQYHIPLTFYFSIAPMDFFKKPYVDAAAIDSKDRCLTRGDLDAVCPRSQPKP